MLVLFRGFLDVKATQARIIPASRPSVNAKRNRNRFARGNRSQLRLVSFVLFFFLKVHDFCRLKPCFPGVPCFNDPATLQGFECGECPLGMVGNGVNCTDVDEVNIEMITLSGNRSSVYRQRQSRL